MATGILWFSLWIQIQRRFSFIWMEMLLAMLGKNIVTFRMNFNNQTRSFQVSKEEVKEFNKVSKLNAKKLFFTS